MGLAPQELRCSATSKQSGQPCQRYATPGSTVCPSHGSKSPQARRTAEERLHEARLELLDMVVPGLLEYRRLMTQAHSEAVRQALLRDLLDRVGLAATSKSQVDVTHHSDRSLDEDIATLLEALATRRPDPAPPPGHEPLPVIEARVLPEDPS